MSNKSNIPGEASANQKINAEEQAAANDPEEKNILNENNAQPPAAENMQKEISLDQIPFLPTQPQTGHNNEQSTPPKIDETMELHHGHSTHHSKKWKDYLFEFLMLFLAVTAGFFAENQREHYLENKRAEQFSVRLLADLRLDSALFEKTNTEITNKRKGYDTLLHRLTKTPAATDKEVLEILLPTTYAFDLPATNTTYNQMKSTGSLRYIENENLTANLQNYYDVLLPRCIKFTDVSMTYFLENINPFYLKHIRIQDYDPFADTLINKQPLIMNRSPQTDQELANIMGGARSLLKIQAITMNAPALAKIKETIAVLKEEYRLE